MRITAICKWDENLEIVQVLDPSSNTVRTIAGSGKPGLADGAGTSAQLSEPGGLCLGPDGSVLVADTNNSVIRCCTCHHWTQGHMQSRDLWLCLDAVHVV